MEKKRILKQKKQKEKTVRIKDTIHPLLAKANRHCRITKGKNAVVLEKRELSDNDVFHMLISHM